MDEFLNDNDLEREVENSEIDKALFERLRYDEVYEKFGENYFGDNIGSNEYYDDEIDRMIDQNIKMVFDKVLWEIKYSYVTNLEQLTTDKVNNNSYHNDYRDIDKSIRYNNKCLEQIERFCYVVFTSNISHFMKECICLALDDKLDYCSNQKKKYVNAVREFITKLDEEYVNSIKKNEDLAIELFGNK